MAKRISQLAALAAAAVGGVVALAQGGTTYQVKLPRAYFVVDASGGDDTTALQGALDAAEAAGGGIVKLGPYEYRFTDLDWDYNNVVIEGTGDIGDTGTVLVRTATTGNAIHVSAQNSGLRNLMVRNLASGAAPTDGFAIHFESCFCPVLENVRIANMYDGVLFENCLEARVQGTLWLRDMFGTKGLEVDGGSGFSNRVIADNPYQYAVEGKQHGARQASHAYVQGDTYTNNGLIFQIVNASGSSAAGGGPTTVPGTTVANARTTDVTDGGLTVHFIGRLIDWTLFTACGGWTFVTGALLNGRTGIRMNGSGANWVFVLHCEVDHSYEDGVALVQGRGFRSFALWQSSSFTSRGCLVDTTFGGEVDINGGCFGGNASYGILLQPGPVGCKFRGIDIGANVFAGFVAGAVSNVGPKHWQVKDCYISEDVFPVSNNQDYGVVVLGSDADYYEITGNDLTGNDVAEIVDGGEGIHSIVQGPGGLVPDYSIFGDGSDGDATISSGTTTLSKDTYYRNLTISGTGALAPGGYRVHVSGLLDLSAAPAGAITRTGNAATAASGATAGTGGTLRGSNTLGQSNAGTDGGTGTTGAGAQASAPTATSPGNGGSGGAGGAGGAANGGGTAGGATRAGASANSPFGIRVPTIHMLRGASLIGAAAGGAGGGSGGGDGSKSGGGGGGGGGGAGPIWLAARVVKRGASTTAASITCVGGVGGAGAAGTGGTAGGGAGGGGGGGGWVQMICGKLVGTPKSGAIVCTGGAGGNGGAGVSTGDGGDGGDGGSGGRIMVASFGEGTWTETVGSAGTADTPHSGSTAGTGGAGGACTATL